MWVYLLVIAMFLYYLDYSFHNSKSGKLFDKIPGPKTTLFIGNIVDFLHPPVPLFYRTRTMVNTYKSMFRTWACSLRILNIYQPHDIEVVLSSSKFISKSSLYNFLHPWLKFGLLTSTGEKWQTRRKILTPAFHFNILRQFCITFDEQSCRLVERLKNEVGKEGTNVIPLVTEFALHSICETAMGTQLETVSKDIVKRYKDSIHTMGECLVYRLVRPWLHSPMTFMLSAPGRLQAKILPGLHKFTTDVIRERRDMRNNTAPQDEESDSADDSYITGVKKRRAMLDLLLAAERKGEIDENGIREEVDTFMFEGHDTTSMAMSFFLMLLANHPEIQERIVAELREIVPDRSQQKTITELNNMRYLERCIKEGLRLYPSVPFIARNIQEDMQLRDYLVPAGTTCHIHIFDVHRNPEIYPAPLVFDPDRFLPENCAKRHPFAYVPFSAGPRNCIGQKFALLEEKSVISSILMNYKLGAVTTPNEIVFSGDLVLRSRDPIIVKFIPRTDY